MTPDLIVDDGSLSATDIRPSDLCAGQAAAFERDIARLRARIDEFVKVGCPACDGTSPAPAFHKHGFRWVRCSRCRTLYMSPRPSPAVMSAYYAASENYEYWAKNIFPASEDLRREKIHRPRLTQILDLCGRYGVSTELLVEIGPGAGTFLEMAAADGAFRRAVGIEPNPAMAAACRARGVEIAERPVEVSGEWAIASDVVAAFEVIEHVFAPREFVQQCHRMMRHGAMLVLTCPNGEGFDIATLQAQSSAIDPEHVNLFNPASLARLLTDGGFEVLECETPGRLDAELVRDAALAGRVDISDDALLRTILIERWNDLGAAFQRFLVRHRLSSHLWMVARKI